MPHALIATLVGGLAVVFLVLFTLALVRRHRPEAAALMRSGAAALGLAGLLFILAGVIGPGDGMEVACGLMFLVFATGVELAPRKGPKA